MRLKMREKTGHLWDDRFSLFNWKGEYGRKGKKKVETKSVLPVQVDPLERVQLERVMDLRRQDLALAFLDQRRDRHRFLNRPELKKVHLATRDL